MSSIRYASDTQPPRSRRAAIVLAAVLVCLVVVLAIGSSLLHALLLQHRQRLQEQYQLQAFWLAESAVQRASVRLAGSRDYPGETWQVDSDALHSRWSGAAVIRVETIPGDDARRKIAVEAEYPQDPQHRVVQRREITVNLSG